MRPPGTRSLALLRDPEAQAGAFPVLKAVRPPASAESDSGGRQVARIGCLLKRICDEGGRPRAVQTPTMKQKLSGYLSTLIEACASEGARVGYLERGATRCVTIVCTL